jgi:hypothetical protein
MRDPSLEPDRSRLPKRGRMNLRDRRAVRRGRYQHDGDTRGNSRRRDDAHPPTDKVRSTQPPCACTTRHSDIGQRGYIIAQRDRSGIDRATTCQAWITGQRGAMVIGPRLERHQRKHRVERRVISMGVPEQRERLRLERYGHTLLILVRMAHDAALASITRYRRIDAWFRECRSIMRAILRRERRHAMPHCAQHIFADHTFGHRHLGRDLRIGPCLEPMLDEGVAAAFGQIGERCAHPRNLLPRRDMAVGGGIAIRQVNHGHIDSLPLAPPLPLAQASDARLLAVRKR